MHACDGRTDGQNYDSQDRASIARAVTRTWCRHIRGSYGNRDNQFVMPKFHFEQLRRADVL